MVHCAELRRAENAPDLSYVVSTTTPGAFPEIRIVQATNGGLSGHSEKVVSSRSSLWAKATTSQRQINSLVGMVQPSVGKTDFSSAEFIVYEQLWRFLLRMCWCSGKGYYQTLDSRPLAPGPDLTRATFMWNRKNRPPSPLFITDSGAPLLPWSFAYYLNETAGCAGEVDLPGVGMWFRALMSATTAPSEAYDFVSQLVCQILKAPSAAALFMQTPSYDTAMQHFSEVDKLLRRTFKESNSPPLPGLRYTLGTKSGSVVPQLTVWIKQGGTEGTTTYN